MFSSYSVSEETSVLQNYTFLGMARQQRTDFIIFLVTLKFLIEIKIFYEGETRTDLARYSSQIILIL